MKRTNYCIISTTTDDSDIAQHITKTLLEKRLVACVQSYPIQSQYHWQGSIVKENEILLHMKSKSSLFKEIKEVIEVLHNYDTAEIIMTPIMAANEAYLNWIDKEVK